MSCDGLSTISYEPSQAHGSIEIFRIWKLVNCNEIVEGASDESKFKQVCIKCTWEICTMPQLNLSINTSIKS